MRHLVTIFVVSTIVTVFAECVFTPHPGLIAVIAALLLAHVLPTWFQAYHDFDRSAERFQAFVYGNSGPVGFGIFLGSIIVNWVLEPSAITIALVAITLLAAIVAMSYWSSSVQSHGARYKLFMNEKYDNAVRELIDILKMHRLHNHANEGIKAIMDGRITELLQADGWFAQAEKTLVGEGVLPYKLLLAREVLARMADWLAVAPTRD